MGKTTMRSYGFLLKIDLWCNGSTKDFDSFCLSSNLGKSTVLVADR